MKMPASEIVKKKITENGGKAVVTSLTGKEYVVCDDQYGHRILCDELPPVYTYMVFDVIVELLETQPDFRAKKGNAHKYKLGEGGCTENTVAGAILKKYFGKSLGESGWDPVFVLAAVLEWAGIVHNRRGYVQLTDSFIKRG